MNLSPLISETEARAISRLPVYGNDEFHAILNLVADAVVHRASRVASGNLGLRLSFPEDPDSTLPRTGEQVFTSFSPDNPASDSSSNAGEADCARTPSDDPAPVSHLHAGDSDVSVHHPDEPAPVSSDDTSTNTPPTAGDSTQDEPAATSLDTLPKQQSGGNPAPHFFI